MNVASKFDTPTLETSVHRLAPPRVTIGLPVFNGEEYLEQAVDSILAQTFEDFELIISDNGSTDRTQEICYQYVLADSRVRYLRSHENLGAARNYNIVFEKARGEYFRWAAHDDIIESTYLERCVSVLDADPSIVLCYPKTRMIDAEGRTVETYPDDLDIADESIHARWERYLIRYYPRVDKCNPIFGLARRDVLADTPLIGNYLSSDMVLLGELALRGKIREVPEPLFLRREHPKTSVKANPLFESRAEWFDPANRGKIILRRWRWFTEYLSAVRRIDAPVSERLRCIGILMRRYLRWSGKPMMKELIRATRQVFGRRAEPSGPPFASSGP